MSIGVNLFDEAERAGVIKSMDQSKKHCPACGAVIPSDSVFCQECGAKLPKITDMPIQNVSQSVETKTVQIHNNAKKKKGWVFPVAFICVLAAIGVGVVAAFSSLSNNDDYKYSSGLNEFVSTDYDPFNILGSGLIGTSTNIIRDHISGLKYNSTFDSYDKGITYFGQPAILRCDDTTISYVLDADIRDARELLFEIFQSIRSDFGFVNVRIGDIYHSEWTWWNDIDEAIKNNEEFSWYWLKNSEMIGLYCFPGLSSDTECTIVVIFAPYYE